MQTEKVHFTKEKETMLLALYSRAVESRSKDPLLRDTMADGFISQPAPAEPPLALPVLRESIEFYPPNPARAW